MYHQCENRHSVPTHPGFSKNNTNSLLEIIQIRYKALIRLVMI